MRVDASCGMRGRATGGGLARILTATQAAFLEAFFAGVGAAPDAFYLSGGTGLAEYYLRHRQSDDLDFFTRDAASLPEAELRMQTSARAVGLEIERVERREFMVRYHFTGDPEPRHQLVKCEAIWDSPPYVAPPRRFGNIKVDDLSCIAVNKITALSRREPKDYIDLYCIIQSGSHRLEDLLPLARGKDPGLEELAIAADFMGVRDLRNIARFQEEYLVLPVDWDEVERFYTEWASRLFDLYPPIAER